MITGYTAWSVVFGEQPSAAKWNILGTNDAAVNLKAAVGKVSQNMAGSFTDHIYIQSGLDSMSVNLDPGGGYYKDVTFEASFDDTNYVALGGWVGDSMTKIFDIGVDLSSKAVNGCRFKSFNAIGAWGFYWIAIGKKSS